MGTRSTPASLRPFAGLGRRRWIAPAPAWRRRACAGRVVAGVPRCGRPFASFFIRRELGRGANAVVYLAVDRRLRRDVALKVLLPERNGDEARARFLREAQAAAALRHPNIVPVHQVGEHSGLWFFTMDAIDGLTLDLWRKEVRPDLRRSVRVLARVCDAIAHAHARGVIHRDLKPANIIVDHRDEPHVTDFGLARCEAWRRDESWATVLGALLGTPHYMSPEQAASDLEAVGERSDVYAMGVILYEIVGGSVPFHNPSFALLLHEIIHAPPPPLERQNPHAPPGLVAIAAKAMAKRPDDRYAGMRALGDDLERWVRGEPVRAAPPRGDRAYRWIAAHPIAAAALLASAVAAGWLAAAARETHTVAAESGLEAQAHVR